MDISSRELRHRLTKAWTKLRLRIDHVVRRIVDRVSQNIRRHIVKLELAAWGVIGIGALCAFPVLQSFLATLLDHNGMEAIRTLLIDVACALIGATAIAASFTLFALQVNIERLPHGLFRHFSSDARLLSAVAASILFAVAGTTLTLISDDHYIALAVELGLLTLALILRLLFYAYRRSLLLINPVQQLTLLHAAMAKSLRRWSRHVDTVARLIELPVEDQPDIRREGRLDLRRLRIMQSHPGWESGLKVAIRQAAAFARRAGETGDLEVSAFALTTVTGLNWDYIAAKGRTFFANQLLIQSDLSTDGVINETLENIRRLVSAALARNHEQQLQQLFNTLTGFVQLYSTIEYNSPFDSKSHALLAAHYLQSAVETVIPKALTDTLMIGVQAMGSAAKQFVSIARPQEAVSLIQKIGVFGGAGAVKPLLRPVTLVAMEQLRDISLNLLRLREADPSFAMRQVQQAIDMVARVFLNIPGTAETSDHNTYLAPIYSATASGALQFKLTEIANALLDIEADNPLGSDLAQNLSTWADGLYDSQKGLLLLAVEKRARFLFDIGHWITNVSEVLLVVANAPATRNHDREQLRKHALWLVSTLSWLPTDIESAKFIENWLHLDNLTTFALHCRQRGEWDCAEAAEKIMLRWALRAGAHQTGWGTLERWLLALTGLVLTGDEADAGDELKAKLVAQLQVADAPNQEMRDRAARDLREYSGRIRDREFETDLVRRLLARADRAVVQKLLAELANILSPDTANEPVRNRHLGF